MTGFGRAEGIVGQSHFTVEIKSLNHRYLDIRFRLPPHLSLFEIPLSEILRSQFERGSFEITVKHRLEAAGLTANTGTRFVVDEEAAKSFFEGCQWIRKNLKVDTKPDLEIFALNEHIVVPIEKPVDALQLFEPFKAIFERALLELKKMREIEGTRIKVILKKGIAELVTLAQALRKLAPLQPTKIGEKLRARIAQWGLTSPVDPQRLEWEISFFAERSEITEELDRLQHHAKEFEILLDARKSIGRKLDFMTQELHREVNTMGAKATLVEITQLTVEAKTIIEKLREQVQNVE